MNQDLFNTQNQALDFGKIKCVKGRLFKNITSKSKAIFLKMGRNVCSGNL